MSWLYDFSWRCPSWYNVELYRNSRMNVIRELMRSVRWDRHISGFRNSLLDDVVSADPPLSFYWLDLLKNFQHFFPDIVFWLCNIFTTLHLCRPVLAMKCLSIGLSVYRFVCLSVCLSNVCIVTKRKKPHFYTTYMWYKNCSFIYERTIIL